MSMSSGRWRGEINNTAVSPPVLLPVSTPVIQRVRYQEYKWFARVLTLHLRTKEGVYVSVMCAHPHHMHTPNTHTHTKHAHTRQVDAYIPLAYAAAIHRLLNMDSIHRLIYMDSFHRLIYKDGFIKSTPIILFSRWFEEARVGAST